MKELSHKSPDSGVDTSTRRQELSSADRRRIVATDAVQEIDAIPLSGLLFSGLSIRRSGLGRNRLSVAGTVRNHSRAGPPADNRSRSSRGSRFAPRCAIRRGTKPPILVGANDLELFGIVQGVDLHEIIAVSPDDRVARFVRLNVQRL
jgi:hypothetical protein